MSGAVGAATGVVSTIAGMGEASRQRKIARQQAEVQQYTQEVQYQQEKMAIAQQKQYAKLTRDLEAIQLAAQDQQMGNALNEQALNNRLEEAQLTYQVAQKELQDRSALDTAEQALNVAEYQQGEVLRQRLAQADTRVSDASNAISQQSGELAKYTREQRLNDAAQYMMAAMGGQQDSLSTSLQGADPGMVLNALMSQENALEGARTQRDLEAGSAHLQNQLGLSDVNLERLGARTQFDVNRSMTGAQRDLLGTGARKNRIAEDLAMRTFKGGTSLRDQQRGIDAEFSDMGYETQGTNSAIRNAGLMSSIQAQQASSKGSLFTGLANVAALGGSLYNAYQTMKPINKPVQRIYQSPQVGKSTTQDDLYNYNFDGGNYYG